MSSAVLCRPHRAVHAFLISAFICVAAGTTAAPAQESQPAQPATPPPDTAQAPDQPPSLPVGEPETTTAVPKRENIQDRIAQIQAASDLPETVKAELLSLYRQALEQLAVADNREVKIKEFETGRERAPELLKELRAQIGQLSTRPSTQPALDDAREEPAEVLSQKLAGKEADLRAAQDAARQLDEEAESRAARKATLPDLLTDANTRLERIIKDLGAAPPVGTAPRIALARRTLLVAQKRAVELEIGEYEAELRYYDARTALLAARREEAKLVAAAAQATVTAWQELVSARRQAEIERQKQAAEEELRSAPAALRALVEDDAKLADEWATVDQRIKQLQERFKTVNDVISNLSTEFSGLRRKEQEEPDALAEMIGPEMRRKREKLLLLRGYERELRALKRESARIERRAWEIDEQTLELANLDTAVAEKVAEIVRAAPRANPAKIEQRVRDLYTARRDALKKMQTDYHAYAEDLRELRAAIGKTLAKADQFRDFIDQHILWLRSTGPLYTARLPKKMLGRGTHWTAVCTSLRADLIARPAPYIAAFLVVLSLLVTRRSMNAELRELGRRVARPLSDSYQLTLRAALITLLLSLPWALLLAFVAWRVSASVDVTHAASYELAQAIAFGLGLAALTLWALSLLQHVCRTKGLAEAHFLWNTAAVNVARRNIRWLLPIAVPITFVVNATERYTDPAWQASVGRTAFIAGMIALAVFLLRLLQPSRGVLANRLRAHRTGWLFNLRYIWFPLAVITPLALAAASAVGYHYTAIQFALDLMRTVWLLLGLILLHAMLVRWLIATQRRLAIEQARRRRAAADGTRAAGQTATAETVELDEAKPDLLTVGDQAKRLLRGLTVLGFAIGAWIIWADLLPALSFMEQVELWPYTVTVSENGGQLSVTEPAAAAAVTQRVEYITLAHLVWALVIATVTFILALNIPGLLEISILQRLPLDTGARYAITALARYTISVVGVIVAFGAIGIGWSKVQWLVAAMTVGLGFGLQEIFANFVSGLILLFERPIRIGDTVTVGDVHGTVTRIRIRATTVTDWDRKELVIPNKDFVTGQVTNWTLSDSVLRIIVPVGIAYGSDTDRAEEILQKVAHETKHVLAEPKPRVLFMGFGDSALNFEVRVFVPAVEEILTVRHRLCKGIDQAFRAAGIEIAFPQRDIHVRSFRQALPISDPREPRRDPADRAGEPKQG